MNVLVFAGAAQLAAIDLMTKNTESLVVIATGLIINLRFLLYSAALSPDLQITVEKMNPSILPVLGYTLETNSQSRTPAIAPPPL